MKLAASVIVALVAVTGCTSKRPGEPAAGGTRGPGAGPAAPQPVAQPPEGLDALGESRGVAAIERAAEAGRYLFVLFRRDDDEQTRKMAQVLDAAMKKVDGRAEQITIDVSDPSERHIVEKFGVDRAPMPLALVLAPNGAVTGGFPVRLEERQLTEAFVGPGTASVLKALQDGKLAFVCVQNSRTTSNAAAMRGVKDFAADAKYAKSTEVVTFDPADAAEARFLKQIAVDPETAKATTVLLAPPGTIAGKFEGATAKDKLVAALEACGAGCGPSSGST